MRCAHCKSRDVDIAHVRECSGVGHSDKFNGDLGLHEVVEQQTGPLWPPSEAQVQYVIGLQSSRTLPDEFVTKDEAQIRLMEKDEVSRLIGELKAMPYQAPTGRGQVTYTMPAGRYALYDPMPGGESREQWRFYQVDKPTEGRWKGYTFIKRLIGAPGDYRKEPITDRSLRARLLDVIEHDPKQAMLDYGLQSGVCGKCSSPLTDPQSLARGVGPICAGKLGW